MKTLNARTCTAAMRAIVEFPKPGDCLLIGDSHAVTNAGSVLGPGPRLRPGNYLPGGIRLWSLHLGPRLAYSIASNGMPETRPISPCFSHIVLVVGEIDIRTRSQKLQPETLEFIVAGLSNEFSIWAKSKAPKAVLWTAVPIPPSSRIHVSDEFPSQGTPEERLKVHARLSRALQGNIESGLGIVDGTALVADGQGYLEDLLSHDGCHLNIAGAKMWQKTLESALGGYRS